MPRLRLIAGPNGSGKSSLIHKLRTVPVSTGIYLNADDFEKTLNTTKSLSLSDIKIPPNIISEDDIIDFKSKNPNYSEFTIHNNHIYDIKFNIDSYFASFFIELIRNKLIINQLSFTFESVMSHISKVELLINSKNKGFTNYLYFVGTISPEINIERVKNRVKKGGHPVPEDKIISRYYKSMENLFVASSLCKRCYFFDNSTESMRLIAQTNERVTTLSDSLPEWFIKYYLDKEIN